MLVLQADLLGAAGGRPLHQHGQSFQIFLRHRQVVVATLWSNETSLLQWPWQCRALRCRSPGEPEGLGQKLHEESRSTASVQVRSMKSGAQTSSSENFDMT